MGKVHELGQPMKSGPMQAPRGAGSSRRELEDADDPSGAPEPVESGLRLTRRWRVLLAHDATAVTCDPLVDAIEGALVRVDMHESSSVHDARLALATSRFDLCMICLDLAPAPLGGVRLAQEAQALRLPVVLITRSLRWIPPTATTLRDLPWVTPDATVDEVVRAATDALASVGANAAWLDGAIEEEEPLAAVR